MFDSRNKLTDTRPTAGLQVLHSAKAHRLSTLHLAGGKVEPCCMLLVDIQRSLYLGRGGRLPLSPGAIPTA